MSEPPHKSDRRKAWDFLRELSTLQSVVGRDQTVEPASIPVLQEVLGDQEVLGETEQPIEAEQDHEAQPAPPAPSAQQAHEETDRELFVQDVINIMMPVVEAEMRRRLLELDDDTLRRWHRDPSAGK